MVGGLAWSIQACNFTVDIDVLYQENATLGQKLYCHFCRYFSYLISSITRALTERIVLVLSRMKCPHAIEPHQIQGGDFIHIFPVVQWLVKRVFDRRAEIGDFNRAYTLNQYKKYFEDRTSQTKDPQANLFKQNVEAIRVMKQKPISFYHKALDLDPSSTETSIPMSR